MKEKKIESETTTIHRVTFLREATRWFEQLTSDRFFQLAHLRADRLDGHIETLGGAREAAFLYDEPEIVEMAIVQHGGLISKKSICRSA